MYLLGCGVFFSLPSTSIKGLSYASALDVETGIIRQVLSDSMVSLLAGHEVYDDCNGRE